MEATSAGIGVIGYASTALFAAGAGITYCAIPTAPSPQLFAAVDPAQVNAWVSITTHAALSILQALLTGYAMIGDERRKQFTAWVQARRQAKRAKPG